MQLTIEQALQQAVAAHKGGNLAEAENIYRAILKSQPKHADANHNLGVIAVSMNQIEAAVPFFKTALDANPNLEQFWLSYLDALVKADRLKDAKQLIKKAKKKGFDAKKLGNLLSQSKRVSASDAEAYNNLGNTLQGQGRLSEAEASYNRALALKPDYAQAHFNLGNTLYLQGRLSEAVVPYNHATALKPEFVEAHYNLGVALQQLGRLSEAEASFNQAIALKPDYAEAHNNLGVALQQLGRLSEAEASFNQAIALRPDYEEAQHNLVDLLTIHTSRNKPSQPIVKAHQHIRECDLQGKTSEIISNNQIADLIDENLKIVKNYDLDLETYKSQIYRRNSVDLNCNRHKEIFAKFNIIPKFCFGCYKVQADPRSLIELVKLSVVFDQIELSENNTRKCMIEMRSGVSGFYKGLVYCSSLNEAYQIAEKLETILEKRIGPGIPVTVKRGCSEYPESFPDYKKINKSGAQPMNYNPEWAVIEEEFDAKHPTKSQKVTSPTLSSLSLSDVLIIRNWIDYARGIGDSSVFLLNCNEVGSQQIYETAKTRLTTNTWLESDEVI